MLTSHIILFLSLTLPGLIIDAQENGDENENENKLGSAKNHLHLWTYVDQEEWKSQYPSCEAPGIRQSPIDIETKKVVVDSDRKLTFVNYDVDTKLKLVNNHHTISIEPIEVTKTPSVKSSWLNREFELAEIHFHWGDGQTVGSEHKIDGQSSLAEAHFVHILKGISRNQTKDIPDSILVIGVLIEPEELNSVNGINLADNFDTILKDFNIVDGNDDEYLGIKPIALNKLLPENTNEFYSYDGSLTTPPCYEVVSWVVMNNKAQVSRDNLLEMSKLKPALSDSIDIKIGPNFRNVQQLGDRQVIASFNPHPTGEDINNQHEVVNEGEKSAAQDQQHSDHQRKYGFNSIKNLIFKFKINKGSKSSQTEEKQQDIPLQ